MAKFKTLTAKTWTTSKDNKRHTMPKRYAKRESLAYKSWYIQQRRKKRNEIEEDTLPTEGLLLSIANGVDSVGESTLEYNVADDSDPLLYNNNDYCFAGSIFTNELSSWAGDFSSWSKSGLATVTGSNIINLPEPSDAVTFSVSMDAGAGTSATFSVKLSGTGTVYIGITRLGGGSYEFEQVEVTLTDTLVEHSVTLTMAYSDHTGFIPYISKGSNGTSDQVTAYDPQVTKSSYLLPYIPPGTTQPSTSGASDGTGYSVEMNEALLECYRGVTDGIELVANGNFDEGGAEWATSANTSISDGGATLSVVETNSLYQNVGLEDGNRYAVTVTMESVSSPVYLWAGGSQNESENTPIGVVGAPTVVIDLTDEVGSNGYIILGFGVGVISSISVQKLEPQPMTTVALVKINEDSANITSPLNLLTINDTAIGLLYADTGGTIKSFDGVNTATVTVIGGWSAGDQIAVVLSTNIEQMSVGYAFPYATGLTTGDPVDYDGSFGPLTHIRYGYGATSHLGFKMFAQFNLEAAEDALAFIGVYEEPSFTRSYDVEMLVSGGQSLNVGGGASNSTVDFKRTPSFALGSSLYLRDFTAELEKESFYGTAFVDIEDNDSNEQYPPAVSTVNTVLQLLGSESNAPSYTYDYRIMPFTWGLSGSSITTMSKGTTPYSDMLSCVAKAKEFALTEGKSFGVPAMSWYQGEADRSQTQAWYFSNLSQLFIDANADIKSITGQNDDVEFFIYQTNPWIGREVTTGETMSNNNIQEAQVQVADTYSNVHMAGAMYQFEYADGFHPADRAVVSLQTGVAVKRVLHDNSPWSTFKPISHEIINNSGTYSIKLKFQAPATPIRFDESASIWHNENGKQANYGFEVLDSGVEQQTLEPFIEGVDTVVLTTSSNPTGMIIRYAVNGSDGGGNLCDSQNITIQNKGVDYVIDNFCVSFSSYIIT